MLKKQRIDHRRQNLLDPQASWIFSNCTPQLNPAWNCESPSFPAVLGNSSQFQPQARQGSTPPRRHICTAELSDLECNSWMARGCTSVCFCTEPKAQHASGFIELVPYIPTLGLATSFQLDACLKEGALTTSCQDRSLIGGSVLRWQPCKRLVHKYWPVSLIYCSKHTAADEPVTWMTAESLRLWVISACMDDGWIDRHLHVRNWTTCAMNLGGSVSRQWQLAEVLQMQIHHTRYGYDITVTIP